MDLIPWVLLAISLAMYPALYFVMRRRKPLKKLDLTAQDLLHDLTRRGAAIIKVEVIDAANLMLRSPR